MLPDEIPNSKGAFCVWVNALNFTAIYPRDVAPLNGYLLITVVRYFNAQILHVSAEKLRASDKVPESCAKGFYKEKKIYVLNFHGFGRPCLGKNFVYA